MNILQDFKLQIYPYSFPSFQRYYYDPIYSLSFHCLLRFIILLLPRKVVRTSFQRFKSEVMSEKKKKWSKFTPLKKRGKKEEKNKRGKIITWWPMEGSELGGPWKESNA
jgi:hypothetical protein